MALPEISVVIPSYNRAAMLVEMMDALARQSLGAGRFEVIVVLDGSTDGSLERLQGLETPFPLKVLDQKNAGVAAARNNGAREARGSFIVFLDDDVLPAPGLLQEHLNGQTANPAGVVLGLLVPGGEGRRGGWNAWEDRVYAKHYRAVEKGQRPPAGRRLYSGNFSVQREAFLKSGGFNETLRRGEDVELGFRLERHDVPFYFNSRASAVHRGYRSFPSWCNSAYLYGQTDVQLAVRRGHNRVLPEIFGWYRRRAAMIHGAVGLSLGRKRVTGGLVHMLRMLAGALSFLRLHRPAHAGYSIIFNIQYWNGVADELGGRQAFYAYAKGRPSIPRSSGTG